MAGSSSFAEVRSPEMNLSAHLRASLSIALIAGCACADDQPVADPDLPQPFDTSITQQLVTHSPFTRTVNFEDSLRLTGIASVDGRPVATFLNKETRQSFTVSEEPNAQGWRLTQASPSPELRDSEVTLQIGDEEVVMHYGDAQLSPGAAKKGIPTVHIAKGETRAKSDGKEQVKASSYLGEGGKSLYASLSSEARSKFKELVKSRIEKQPDLTEEQRSAYATKIFSSLLASDQKTSGDTGGKTKKSGKNSKLN
jgi:hypothetical protein